MATSEAAPNRKLQFSLRKLLVCVCLLCAILGVWSTPDSMRTILYTCYIGIGLVIVGLVYRRRTSVVVGIVAVGVSVPLHSFVSSWDYSWNGQVARSVCVTVVDGESELPIPGASVTLAHAGINRYVTLIADDAGTVTFDWSFYTSGQDYLLWKTGCIHVGWEELRTESDGYSSHRLKLNSRIPRELPLDSSIPAFSIRLIKADG